MAKSSRNERIISRVRAIPEGFVRTYGDIDPLAPRLVGRILSQTHDKLLVAEGVPMRGERVDLEGTTAVGALTVVAPGGGQCAALCVGCHSPGGIADDLGVAEVVAVDRRVGLPATLNEEQACTSMHAPHVFGRRHDGELGEFDSGHPTRGYRRVPGHSH